MIKYPHDTSWTLERSESSHDVLVEYGVEERGQDASGWGEHYDPGSGWVFYINPVADGVTLTDEEIEAIHLWLEENHEEDDGWDEDY